MSTPPQCTLNDMLNEIMSKIWSYLPFKDRCRLGAINTRMRSVSMMPEFWRRITIPNQDLTYTLMNNIISMGTQSLSIPWSSVKGDWLEYKGLKNILKDNVSNLEYLDLSGCNGSGISRGDDDMVALLVAKSTKLKILDLSASRVTLVNTIAGKLPWDCHITALNLSVIGNNSRGDLLHLDSFLFNCHIGSRSKYRCSGVQV